MLNGIKQKAVVNNGKVELSVPELSEGTEVEIILLVEADLEEDETTYLLKSEGYQLKAGHFERKWEQKLA